MDSNEYEGKAAPDPGIAEATANLPPNNLPPLDQTDRKEPTLPPVVKTAPKVTLAYRVSDRPEQTPHDIWRFGDDEKFGAESFVRLEGGTATWEIYPIAFKGVEVNNFDRKGEAVLARGEVERDQLLSDLAVMMEAGEQ